MFTKSQLLVYKNQLFVDVKSAVCSHKVSYLFTKSQLFVYKMSAVCLQKGQLFVYLSRSSVGCDIATASLIILLGSPTKITSAPDQT